MMHWFRNSVEYNRQIQALFLVCEKDKVRHRAAMDEARRLVESDGVTPTEAVRRVKQRLVLASGLDPADDQPDPHWRGPEFPLT